MLISEAIAAVKSATGVATVDDATMIRWLSELDGKIAFDVFGADAWSPYTSDDTGAELLVDYPWDGQIYIPWLESMIFYTLWEYDRYENAKAMYESALWEFRKYYNRTHAPIAKCLTRCLQREVAQECPLS